MIGWGRMNVASPRVDDPSSAGQPGWPPRAPVDRDQQLAAESEQASGWDGGVVPAAPADGTWSGEQATAQLPRRPDAGRFPYPVPEPAPGRVSPPAAEPSVPPGSSAAVYGPPGSPPADHSPPGSDPSRPYQPASYQPGSYQPAVPVSTRVLSARATSLRVYISWINVNRRSPGQSTISRVLIPRRTSKAHPARRRSRMFRSTSNKPIPISIRAASMAGRRTRPVPPERGSAKAPPPLPASPAWQPPPALPRAIWHCGDRRSTECGGGTRGAAAGPPGGAAAGPPGGATGEVAGLRVSASPFGVARRAPPAASATPGGPGRTRPHRSPGHVS